MNQETNSPYFEVDNGHDTVEGSNEQGSSAGPQHEIVVYGSNSFSWETMKTAQVKVPLLTVIGIALLSLCLLGGVIFLMAHYFTTKNLDEVRIAHITQIEKALTDYRKAHGSYPEPYKGVEILKSGNRIGVQGFMGEQTLDIIGLDRMVDPKDSQYYTYYLSDDAQTYELLAEMHNDYRANRNDKMFGPAYSAGGEGNIVYANVGSAFGTPIHRVFDAPVLQLGSYNERLSEFLVSGDSCANIQEKYPDQKGKSGLYPINLAGDVQLFWCNMERKIPAIEYTFMLPNEYVNADECVTYKIVDKSEVTTLLQHAFVPKSETDINMEMYADNSVNPSVVSILQAGKIRDISIGDGVDHTVIVFSDQGTLSCLSSSQSGSHACGKRGLPEKDEVQGDAHLLSMSFFPRCRNATAHNDQWYRNKFNLSGTKYSLFFEK